MSFTDNFGNPKGLLGRMMLVSMDKEHLPMAQWALKRIKIPGNGKVADLGCGGGYNIRRMLEMSAKAKFIEDNSLDLIDPIGCEKIIESLSTETDTFMSKVDATLSISNALTKITVEY